MLRQAIREAEQGQLRSELESHNQEIITVTVQRVIPESGDAVVSLGKTEAVLYKSEQLPDEVLQPNDIIKVYVAGVRSTDKNTRATISRTHPGLVRRLFEEEVPEIFDGTVEIKAVAREAGSRTKMAVYSADPDVDPVGACIGPRGARVGKIVDLLGGEKIDIVKYSDVPEEFIPPMSLTSRSKRVKRRSAASECRTASSPSLSATRVRTPALPPSSPAGRLT